MKNEPKQYPINSLDDLCDLVNDENAERLAIDLVKWLISYKDCINVVRENQPELTKSLKNTQIAKGSFIWIDDGKNDIKDINVIISDSSK